MEEQRLRNMEEQRLRNIEEHRLRQRNYLPTRSSVGYNIINHSENQEHFYNRGFRFEQRFTESPVFAPLREARYQLERDSRREAERMMDRLIDEYQFDSPPTFRLPQQPVFQQPIPQQPILQREYKSGFPRESVEVEEDIDLICSVCQDIYRDPKSVSCGHIFCDLCITQALRIKNECPTCKCSTDSNNLRNVPIIKTYINKLIIKCPNDGCDFKNTIEQYREHELNCDKK